MNPLLPPPLLTVGRIIKIWLARLIGSFFMLFGFVGMLTPIPFGLVFFIIGLMFLIPTTPGLAKVIMKTRKRIRLFDRLLTLASQKLPTPYRRILRQTEIGED